MGEGKTGKRVKIMTWGLCGRKCWGGGVQVFVSYRVFSCRVRRQLFHTQEITRFCGVLLVLVLRSFCFFYDEGREFALRERGDAPRTLSLSLLLGRCSAGTGSRCCFF